MLIFKKKFLTQDPFRQVVTSHPLSPEVWRHLSLYFFWLTPAAAHRVRILLNTLK